ncbi:hypothetical protein A249_39310 [Pseudomonas syringae pv. actinidiae ICMP 18804]|uniref:Uncharacterized protein n=2 Tax=Pseudomonas syringae TaxID=317 RepID=A0A656JI38_PSESF|nr:hypothetical protein [Pseudomonas syringae]EPM69170.1 hypothetical protein A249_39310 [Pseudomonas syringae pv. actinidiae ICMP 18804]EPN26794.1 hypothetical protein A245_47575 [Pseudomonas syringae pv. actinidiae ICMP 19096]EPN29525.1 hypothetical protein A247_00815 [Pseudomonas syringae pv. actinidiae ICMP 19099]EPN47810.1 hypothetical protein A241_26971 [Pseudomonas syringae pv. actinidiae ICMP 19094]KTC45988.1 hypothetical protein AO250_26635 [Pseudomonas syringae pv. actinidiae ICMP 19
MPIPEPVPAEPQALAFTIGQIMVIPPASNLMKLPARLHGEFQACLDNDLFAGLQLNLCACAGQLRGNQNTPWLSNEGQALGHPKDA